MLYLSQYGLSLDIRAIYRRHTHSRSRFCRRMEIRLDAAKLWFGPVRGKAPLDRGRYQNFLQTHWNSHHDRRDDARDGTIRSNNDLFDR